MSKSTAPSLIITAGDPAGVGLDIVCDLAQYEYPGKLVVITDNQALAQRAAQLGKSFEIVAYQKNIPQTHQLNQIVVQHIEYPNPCQAGTLNTDNSKAALMSLAIASDACLNGEFDGLVTGPLHKAAINQAGIPFSGHTEFLQQHCQVQRTVMLFVSPIGKISLATTHMPLKDVANAITQQSLTEQLTLLHQSLTRFFNCQGRIAVVGLNPHAGENGHLGDEEIRHIIPAIKEAQQQGIDVSGPFAADTIFNQAQQFDVIHAMYHDQALPVIKTHDFGDAVNVTLGLPFVRTSVDHGTALDIAGSGQAKANSLFAALEVAKYMGAQHE